MVRKSPVSELHKQKAKKTFRAGVLLVSDSRHDRTDLDVSGKMIVKMLKDRGVRVFEHAGIPDDVIDIQEKLRDWTAGEDIDVIITTGGTGISPDDVTIEAVKELLTKEIPGFGEIFRKLSYDVIGSPAFISRALAGVIDDTLVFCLPGSPDAVRLAMEKIILPEAGHMLAHVRRYA